MRINGRELAGEILETLAMRVHELQKNYDIMPHLAVLRVSDDPAVTSYIAQKEKMAKKIGAYVSVYNFPEDTTEKELMESIEFLQTKGDIHGIILQLPIPAHLNADKLLHAIEPTKDIDGFHPQTKFGIPITGAVVEVLNYVYTKDLSIKAPSFIEWLKKQKIVIVGKGKTGGQPLITFFNTLHLSPIVIDSKTKNPWDITKSANILISAVGKKNVITEDMLKKDVILLGIGMAKGENEKFQGDYDEDEIKDIASWYTPIPGGIGPVNVAKLLENLVIAAENSVALKN